MKKALLILSIFVLILSCKKEEKEEEPMVGPTIVLDQVKIEENIVGIWKGMIKGSNGSTENVEATIEKMTIGNKVANGRYFESSFSCGFEWTYESLANGRVTFREKTLNPDICFDDVAVITYFQDDKFNTLYVRIAVSNASYTGALTRQ